jgi:excisionase family DNA binding protein
VDNALATAQEVADFLGVPLRSIYQWRTAGKSCPPALRVGKHLRFRWADVERWVGDEMTRQGRGAA